MDGLVHCLVPRMNQVARVIPTPVKALLQAQVKVVLAEAGCEHTAAVGADGSLYTWGHNDSGRLGHGADGDGAGHGLSASAAASSTSYSSSSSLHSSLPPPPSYSSWGTLQQPPALASPYKPGGGGGGSSGNSPVSVTLPRRVESLHRRGLRAPRLLLLR